MRSLRSPKLFPLARACCRPKLKCQKAICIAFADYVIVLAVQVLLYGMDTAVLVAVGVLGYAILTNYANMSS